MTDKPRRSAGMRGTPRNENFEPFWPPPAHSLVSTPPQPVPSAPRSPSSRFAKPKVLMDAVSAPKGVLIAAQRDAFRAFMIARRLRPTLWAREAGVPQGEILAFLTGRAREFSPGVAEKLAAAAGASVQEMFE